MWRAKLEIHQLEALGVSWLASCRSTSNFVCELHGHLTARAAGFSKYLNLDLAMLSPDTDSEHEVISRTTLEKEIDLERDLSKRVRGLANESFSTIEDSEN